MTSHDCVNLVRRLTGEGRVGHCGTLDPFATGVLLICVGSCTRLSNYLMASRKVYEARIRFGTSTTTDDCTGEVLEQAALPKYGADILEQFTGELDQLPPRYSAIKTNGVKAYEQARKGQEVVREPRRVIVYSAELLDAQSAYWDVCFEVSKGTYIRSLARDIGVAAGSAAHLEKLRRVQSGSISVDACKLTSELETADDVASAFVDPVAALGLPQIEIDAKDYKAAANGAAILLAPTKGSVRTTVGANCVRPPEHGNLTPTTPQLYAITHNNKLLGIYHLIDNNLKPNVILNGGVSRV
jgi:tRNA pseudouridine55 synthase